jgi:hypothetical protein
MKRRFVEAVAFATILTLIGISTAFGQTPDFLHPQQKGLFQANGIAYLELGGYTDPVNIGYPVPTIDQTIQELKATSTNVVKLTFNMYVRNATDNSYDPTFPFPSNGKPENILAFGRKLTAQGIPGFMQPFSQIQNVVVGAGGNDRVNPTDRRAFMVQHISRLVYLAQLAESMGCEYYDVFGDEIEHLVVDPNLADLWLQAIAQVRAVFSGRLTSTSSWGEKGGPYTFRHQAQVIGMLDSFGIGFFPAFTDHADPSITELLAAFQRNSQGHNSLLTVTQMHSLYQSTSRTWWTVAVTQRNSFCSVTQARIRSLMYCSSGKTVR